MKILVADDEAIVLKIVLRLLEFLKHEVVPAENGEVALAYLRDHQDVDLVILDQNMPGLTGTDVLERLRAFQPTVPVLISTGDRAVEISDANAELLEKPYRLDTLEAMLAKFEPIG